MKSKNRYKFVFGEKTITLTTDKDNLFMEEVERVAKEKYAAIKEKLPQADDEMVAILMAINSLSTQLSREIEARKRLLTSRRKPVNQTLTRIKYDICYSSNRFYLAVLHWVCARNCSANLLPCG